MRYNVSVNRNAEKIIFLESLVKKPRREKLTQFKVYNNYIKIMLLEHSNCYKSWYRAGRLKMRPLRVTVVDGGRLEISTGCLVVPSGCEA